MDLGVGSPDPMAELLPPLGGHEATVEANRCLYCYDAPCTHACPTHIDIPRFIKKIATGNLVGSARTIFDSNLLGATCARVCPVQELCEGACVLGKDHKPISIGRLQRFATDDAAARGADVLTPGPASGKRVAVIGSGPAGLSCAGELRRAGHEVVVFEKRALAGGLSTFGIIKLREPMEIALGEAEALSRVGVLFEYGAELGGNVQLTELLATFDAVFLGLGLGSSPSLGIPGEELILDGLEVIEQSKVAASKLQIGRNVVVIGAGNTAIDCATIAKRYGAESVSILYRRTAREMTAYPHEYEFIKSEGVRLQFLTQPVRVVSKDGRVEGLECVRMELGDADVTGRAWPAPVEGSEFLLPADQVMKAIGQARPRLAILLGLDTVGGYIRVNENFETSIPRVFAGGDGIRSQGAASTVMAVQDGKLAARAIDRRMRAQEGE